MDFFAFDSSGDGVTGKADGDWTKRLKKSGGAWGAMTVTVSEGENGWYTMTLSSSHTDTLGVLSISLSASGVKRVNLQFRVHARVPDDLAYPTTSGRSIDVTAGGEVGIDWANVGSPTATVNLSGTTVKTATDVEADTADIQSRLPAALVSGRMDASVGAMASNTLTAAALAADAVAEIQSGLSTLTAADVQAECEDALEAYHLDHLVASADPGGVVANNSFLAKLVSSSATAAFSDFNNTTDSLQALRDRGDAAWITATGFSTHSAADVWVAGTRTLTALDEDSTTLDLDATIRAAVGLASANLDTQLSTIDTNVDAVLVDTGTTLDGKLDTIDANVDAVLADTGTDGVVVAAGSKAGYSLAGGGLAAVTAWTVDITGSLSGSVGSVTGNVGGNVTGSVGSLAAQAKADVNAEVVDALATDTYAEPTGAPAATATLAAKLGYLAMALRNRVTVTASAKTFYDDSGNAEWSKALSDDGTTYSEAEGA